MSCSAPSYSWHSAPTGVSTIANPAPGCFPATTAGIGQSIRKRFGTPVRKPPSARASRKVYDRRSYALHLTENGRNALKAIGRIAREHQEGLLAALSSDERQLLASFLQRIADQQSLTRNVHPGYGRLGARNRTEPDPCR